jgi:hypothetical protein
MGNQVAQGYAEAVEDGLIDLTQALSIHLASNHYPPVHPSFVQTALEAIRLANDGLFDEEVTMANGLVRSVQFVVEGLHLWAFLDDNS